MTAYKTGKYATYGDASLQNTSLKLVFWLLNGQNLPTEMYLDIVAYV